MVALLAIEKHRLLGEYGRVTRQDFDAAWDTCWTTMVQERAFPHATVHRRAWRSALLATRCEARAAFVGDETAFSFAVERLSAAAEGMCLRLEPDQIPKALLAAIVFVELPEPHDHDLAAA